MRFARKWHEKQYRRYRDHNSYQPHGFFTVPTPATPIRRVHSPRCPFAIRTCCLPILFGALISFAHDLAQQALLLGLAVLQLIEGRVPLLKTQAAAWLRYFCNWPSVSN